MLISNENIQEALNSYEDAQQELSEFESKNSHIIEEVESLKKISNKKLKDFKDLVSAGDLKKRDIFGKNGIVTAKISIRNTVKYDPKSTYEAIGLENFIEKCASVNPSMLKKHFPEKLNDIENTTTTIALTSVSTK